MTPKQAFKEVLKIVGPKGTLKYETPEQFQKRLAKVKPEYKDMCFPVTIGKLVAGGMFNLVIAQGHSLEDCLDQARRIVANEGGKS